MFEKCDIDFFCIDTPSFINVKDYHEIINYIRELNFKHKKNIGIIAELKGRKIKPIAIYFTNDMNNNFVLKKNTKVVITNKVKKHLFSIDRNEIVVQIRNLHKMIAINDKIIINDNKGCLIVQEIQETNLLSTCRKSKTFTNLAGEEDKQEHRIKKVSSQINSVFIDNEGDFNYENELENYDIGFEIDNKLSPTNRQSINVSRYAIDDFEIQRKKTRLLRSRSFFNETKYEILCRVEYDCIYNINSYLYIPNIDFAKFDVNILSSREVAEIASLRDMKVNFISITISSNKDINSLKEILGDDNKIKILASISDYRSLSNIVDIVNFADGVIVSRTFQMICKENRNKVNNINSVYIYD
jgi:hypothetical protein